ncbi:hypothetical protein GRF59_16290 [Paenibacillus sp. HJL G12]|uniref:Uncharacterized protein n=1 Tax=Paenibacillus dendrobii TaxID=2691084 RepID=A0A7X3LIE4_9BACL|nr:hypothetical protein [Paenibacillus dendrobii]MWV45185.1 hypothetical protein [Paenibacillus dendrobii]
MINHDGSITRIEIYYYQVLMTIDLIVIRLNRGQSVPQAVEEVSNMDYSIMIGTGLKMTHSSHRLEFSQLLIYYKFSDYFFLLLECLRAIRSWESNKACDALVILKSRLEQHIIFDNERYHFFSRKEKNSPESLEKTVQRFLFENHLIKQEEFYNDFGFIRPL